MLPTTIIILVFLALVFNFINGFHDSSNIVATIIFSRAMSPRKALILTAVAEFCGPFFFGVAVAKTIGEGIVTPSHISTFVILAALISAIAWNLFTWFFGIPSSSSHALIGGLVGAVVVSVGFSSIHLNGMIKVLVALFVSPVLGLITGYMITRLVFLLARDSSLKINSFFRNIQILTGVSLALSHGANDAQKSMGIITLGLVSGGILSSFEVPFWVITSCAILTSLGTYFGGWRLIRTLGSRFYRIRPVDGFCAQVSSTSIILGAALLGGPVSTTQVVSSAILGVGAAERFNKVRWGVAGNIGMTWFFTIPSTAILAALIYLLISTIRW
jgi:inorganic phosphate transporter, PiT family